MTLIIAIVGLTGSGKSAAAEFFEDKGFKKIRFGQVTIDILNEKSLEINEANEKKVREELREEYGMAAYAIKNIPKINDLLEEGNVVIDGLYSWSEYKVLKQEYGDKLTVLAVQTSPSLRYKRLAERKERPLSNEEALSRDFSEIENIEKAGPIAIADYTVVNEGSLDKFKNEIECVYKTITGEKMTKRPSKIDYYLEIAKEVSKRSTCLRRRFGAVIVSKSDKIIATGYNGAIRKARDCMEIGRCMRQALGIKPGERYELCKSFHAEQNAILSADPAERRGAAIYVYGENTDGTIFPAEPCMMCKRTLVQGELDKVIAKQPEGIKEWNVKEFVVEENFGKNFPQEIKESNDFKEYIKHLSGE